MLAVSQSGEALVWASSALCSDQEVVLTAVTQYGGAIEIAAQELQNDTEFLQHAAVAMAPRYFLFRVAMLSGHSCVTVSDSQKQCLGLSHCEYLSAHTHRIERVCCSSKRSRSMRDSIVRCRFGLPDVEGAELILDTLSLPKMGICTSTGVEAGRVNEELLGLTQAH
eukprot:3315392-Amphidinium_carterae.1